MSSRLIQSISILLVLTATTMAQARRQPGPSLQERERQLEPLIIESAKRYGIDPRILRTVCFIESRFRLDAVSPKGARGLMQFMPETAAAYGLQNPHDPKTAIAAAAHYLRDLLKKFGGRVDLALAAYNTGEGTVESFQTGRPLLLASGKIINPRRLITGGMPPYRETQKYVKSAIVLLMNGPYPSATFLTSLSSVKSLSQRRTRDQNNRSKSPSSTRQTNSLFIEVQ
jgi:soluble lytic murein transglycosylase-like protein